MTGFDSQALLQKLELEAVKPGDKVRFTGKYPGARQLNAQPGATGVVGPRGIFGRGAHHNGSLLDVIWDKNSLSEYQMDGGYFVSSFELLEGETYKQPTSIDYLEITRSIVGR